MAHKLLKPEYFNLLYGFYPRRNSKEFFFIPDKDYTSPDHKDRSKKRKRKHLKRSGVILMEEDSK